MADSYSIMGKQRQRAYRTELDPTRTQAVLMEKHARAARFAWNWGLGRRKDIMNLNRPPIERIKVPTAVDLHRELNRLKRTLYPWLYEVSKCAPQEAMRDLDRAFKSLYESGFGFPKFKSKKWAKKSFRLTGSIVVADNAVRLPRLGWIRLKERGYLPPERAVHITAATVSERADRWFVSLCVQEDLVQARSKHSGIVGVDLGISTLATISDGTVYPNQKALPRMERRLKRLQHSVSRRQKDSNNRAKAVRLLQRQHFRIANVRKDAINKATTELAKSKSVLVVESLRPKSMTRNHRLAKSLMDAAFGEFVRQLEYKTLWYGSRLVKADPFFPSTKRCSKCGNVKDEIPLGERTYRCEKCGLVMDRDLNAAINLSQWPSVRRTLKTPVGARRLQVERPVPGDETGIIMEQVGSPICP